MALGMASRRRGRIRAGRPAIGIAPAVRAAPVARIALPFLGAAVLPGTAAAAELATGWSYSHEIVLTAVLTGVLSVAVASAVGMMRARTRAEQEIERLKSENADLKIQADRAEALLDSEDQVVVAWGRPEDPPVMVGTLGPAAGAPKARAQFLAFGSWLAHDSAAVLDHRIAALRERGTAFTIELAT